MGMITFCFMEVDMMVKISKIIFGGHLMELYHELKGGQDFASAEAVFSFQIL